RFAPVGPGEPALDAADDGGRLVEVRVGEQQHELVATNAGELISRTQHRLRRRREVDQRGVTGLVTLDVVDLLQPVEIQERDRQRLAPPLEAGDLDGTALLARPAVGEPRQGGEAGPARLSHHHGGRAVDEGRGGEEPRTPSRRSSPPSRPRRSSKARRRETAAPPATAPSTPTRKLPVQVMRPTPAT